ncbi:energy transducer TonB [Paraburkholderia heleia]|uniref:energy transducer TonB n=1 Tax=Paraburkholderia heleia TaxID=634127 RepID=UPI0031D2CA4F
MASTLMRQLASTTTGWSAGATDSTRATRDKTRARRIAATLGVVMAAHAGLLAWVLTARERTFERAVEAPLIVATLLTEAPDAATPAPAARAVPPAPPAPAAPRNRPAPHASSAHSNARQPLPRMPITPAAPATPPAALPPQAPATSPAPAPMSPASASPTPSDAPAANAAAHATPASSAPKTVSHVDCNIPAPDYPEASKRRGESGTSVVRFVVGLSGKIESVQLQRSSGYTRLDEAALAAIEGGTCQTYRENGEPVRAAYAQSFVFGLSN